MTIAYPTLQEKRAWLTSCQDGVLYDATDYYVFAYDLPPDSGPRHPQAYVRIHLDRLDSWARQNRWRNAEVTKCPTCGQDEFWALVDEDLAETVCLVWQLGIPTRSSCQGDSDVWVYITFYDAESLWQFVFTVTAMDRDTGLNTNPRHANPATFVARAMRNFSLAHPDDPTAVVPDAWRYDFWHRTLRFPSSDHLHVVEHLRWWKREEEQLDQLQWAYAVSSLLVGVPEDDEDDWDEDR